jgi:hypothetical protein
MWQFKTRIRPVDKLYSQVVRKRDKMLCQYNFRCLPGTTGDQTSHWQKRRKEGVRCDLRNGDWVCAKCHFFVENDPQGQKTLDAWKLKQLGEKEYKLVLLLANDDSRKHKDDKMNILILKELMKSL